MFLFRKKEMDIAAAKQFWKWFVENEQWIIDNVSSNGVEVVWAIDAQIKPVFPYFKKNLNFNWDSIMVLANFSSSILETKI